MASVAVMSAGRIEHWGRRPTSRTTLQPYVLLPASQPDGAAARS